MSLFWKKQPKTFGRGIVREYVGMAGVKPKGGSQELGALDASRKGGDFMGNNEFVCDSVSVLGRQASRDKQASAGE